mgnify:CR=1 FL=1
MAQGGIEHKEHTEQRKDDTRSPDGRGISGSTEPCKDGTSIEDKQEMRMRAVETATIDIPHRRVHQGKRKDVDEKVQPRDVEERIGKAAP